MWWTIVNHGLVNWIGCLVWEDASGKTRNNFLDFELMTQRKNIVVDGHIDSEKLQICFHVTIKTTDFGSQMNNMSWSMLFEYLSSCLFAGQIGILRGKKNKSFIISRITFVCDPNTISDQPGSSGNEYYLLGHC